MTHPLITQLKFTRSEFQRGLQNISDEDARKRFMPMNCISWIIGHLAWQEQRYWLTRAQGIILLPEINELAALGAPASIPPLDQMWDAWHTIMKAVDPYLEALTTPDLTTFMIIDGQPHTESVGSMLRRVTYHYWYHLGEAQAIRQMLGHGDLKQFVGDIHDEAPYIAENGD